MGRLSELYYGFLPILHAIGAILAVSLSFACDTGRAVQVARIPTVLPLPPGLSRDSAFMAAYPWDEGAEFVTHNWNPFALIFVFEWLTAGFALRPLQYFVADEPLLFRLWLVWLGLGLLLFVTWSFTNSGGVCVAMFFTVLASFVMSGVVAFYSLASTTMFMTGTNKDSKHVAYHNVYSDREGRTWKIPSSVQGLSNRRAHALQMDAAPEQEYTEDLVVDKEYERVWGVVFRYAEYCITAPLLFLAVTCLMVVDAPAWLFLTGYWLLVVCNAVGIALHLSFTDPPPQEEKTVSDQDDWLSFMMTTLFPGPW